MTDKRITVERPIDASTDEVFDVLSNPEAAPPAGRVGVRAVR